MTANTHFEASAMDEYDVYCEFDIKKHKKKYINYLEVMIDRDGNVHYAVPSHQEWAIKMACCELRVTRDTLCNMTPPEYYFDWLTWLLKQTGAMAVWNNTFVCESPTRAQCNALRRLKLGGVYHGALPKVERKE